MTQMTQEQFAAVQGKIDTLVRGAKRGTPERAAADAIDAEWEAANSLPQATVTQRDARRDAIAAVAAKHGLL